MIAESIIFDFPFDMSKVSRGEILERYQPYEHEDTWKREYIDIGEGDNALRLIAEKLILDDMVIIRITPPEIKTMANLYLTSGIFDALCPKLIGVELLDSGFLLFYPRFKDNPEHTEKVQRAVDEILRVSMFLLETLYPREGLGGWRKALERYISMYYVFVDKETLKKMGDRKIVKRVYRNIF